jgi:CO/xanthine dehydrogenase FAD-binding subunit
VTYAKPTRLEEALRLIAEGGWRLLAGGTDFYPALVGRPMPEKVLDLNGLEELRGISSDPSHWRIGARATWSEVIRAELPPAFDALKLAAREVGSVQIQNAGTVAGNLCNASPAADGVPALLVLDAEVVLRSVAAERALPLSHFILGNRRTTRREEELVTAIRIPRASTGGHSGFLKLGARKYLVISIAMAAARIAVEGTRIREAAIAVGSCSEVAQRLPALERALAGQTIDAVSVAPEHLAPLAPISDVRGTADYRRDAALELVRRTIAQCLSGRRAAA